MHKLVLIPLIVGCMLASVQSDFFAQSFGGAGASSSSGSAVSSSNSGSISNSAISSRNSAVSSSSNSASSSSSNSASSSSSNSASSSSSNSAASSGSLATSSGNAAAISSSNSAASSGTVAISSSRSASSSDNSAISSGNSVVSSGNSAISSGNSVVSSGNSASAGASAAAAGYQDQGLEPGPVPPAPEPIPPVPLPTPLSPLDQVAWAISDGLINSPVLGEYAQFNLYQPYEIFYESGRILLEKAGFYDPDLQDVVAQAVVDVNYVYTQLYFDAIGYFLADFVNNKGILTSDNAEYLSLRFVAAVDLQGCTTGVYDTQSMIDSVVLGFFNVLDSYGFNTYDDLAEMFHSFADTLRALANSSEYQSK